MGLLDIGSKCKKTITEKLKEEKTSKLIKTRVHPFNVLVALNLYKIGHGEKGHLKWKPNEKVMAALDSAYYLFIKAVEPTGKRYMLAIYVSDSMNKPCMGAESLTCRDAATAMTMVTLRTEKDCEVFAFSHEFRHVHFTKEDNHNEVIEKLKIPSGVNYCALPMLYAMEKKRNFDAFIVYTHNETRCGKVHLYKAIDDYRMKRKIKNAKLIVVGMASNGFAIANPDDGNMLDIAGFDSGAIEIMHNFITMG